jgi:ParB-like chromosome segregation protein Spo0J
MNIVSKKISDLIHPDYNPRQISKADFEQLKKSLNGFGAVEPAVINTSAG